MHYNINQQTKTDRAPYFLPALSNIPIFLPGSNLPARTNPATCRRQQAGTPKVLDHYASDSLKLKAAIFLIENMPGHYSLDGPYLRQLQRIIDSTGTPYLMKKVILMQPLRYPYSRQQLRAEPDLEQVKADYLIHQIDQTFRLWTNSPWLEDLTLESFLEYLLPYRIGNEPLDYWRDSIDSRLRERLQEAGRLL